jgi:hypothetical protein
MVGLNDAYRASKRQRDHDGSARRMRIDPVGRCLLVSVDRIRRSARRMARRVPVEPNRLTVVMPDADITLIPELAQRLRRWVPVEWESIRLIAADSAVPGPDGRSAAQELSDMLGAEVIGPDGDLVALPDGTLFVRAKRDRTDLGAWWRCRPGRSPEAIGRRYPAPDWEPELAGFNDPGIAGVDVEEIPAGLWVHWSRKTRGTDLAYAVPVQDSSMALVVSCAGDPPLRAADVRRLIQAMPETLRERLLVIPYGDEPVADTRLGALVAESANRALPIRNGVPLLFSGHHVQTVAVGRNGRPTWRPFARELAWRPGGGARIVDWRVPSDQLLPVGPAQLLLNDRWTVEVVEAGLWIREASRLEGAASVRQLPLDSRHCTVVVGTQSTSRARPPWRAIAKLLRRLPADARVRVRLAVPRAADGRMALAAEKICRNVLGGRPLCLLTTDGRLMVHTFGVSRDDRRRPQVEDDLWVGLSVEDADLDSDHGRAGETRRSPYRVGRPRVEERRAQPERIDVPGRARQRTNTPVEAEDDRIHQPDGSGRFPAPTEPKAPSYDPSDRGRIKVALPLQRTSPPVSEPPVQPSVRRASSTSVPSQRPVTPWRVARDRSDDGSQSADVKAAEDSSSDRAPSVATDAKARAANGSTRGFPGRSR